MQSYFLAEGAASDLDAIFEYSYQQWGPDQAFAYLEKLHECAEALASGKARHQKPIRSMPNLRMMHCQRHYIYCSFRSDGPSAILAGFHEKMDLMARLAERLQK